MGKVNDKTNRSRVLFTGSNNIVIEDLMKHVPIEYQLDKCVPQEAEFKDALQNFDPHTIVVCLSGESRETLRMFAVLERNSKHFGLPIIAIGNGEDCETFRRKVVQKNMQLFVRPLDKPLFMDTLVEFLKQRTAELENEQEPDDLSESFTNMNMSMSLREKIEKAFAIHGRQTVLVVDDDITMLNVIKLYLQDLYDVVVVPSGKVALKYLSKKKADIVLLDYMMPEEDGPMVLKNIRTNSPQPNIPVLFLTGVDDSDMVMRGLEYRPNGYLLKPVTREVLLEKTTEIILGLV